MQRHFREQIAFQTKFFFSLTDSDCGIFALRVNQCFVNSLSVPCCVYLRLPTSLFQFKSRSFTLGSLLHSSSFGLSRNLVCVGRDANSGEDCVTIVCDFISIICMHTFTIVSQQEVLSQNICRTVINGDHIRNCAFRTAFFDLDPPNSC